jgi:hypothetical protein
MVLTDILQINYEVFKRHDINEILFTAALLHHNPNYEFPEMLNVNVIVTLHPELLAPFPK